MRPGRDPGRWEDQRIEKMTEPTNTAEQVNTLRELSKEELDAVSGGAVAIEYGFIAGLVAAAQRSRV